MNISKQSQFQNLNYKDFIIRDVEKVNWQEDFDTVILGYTDRIENLIKFDYKEYILKMCIKHKKNIYMFDNSPQYNALIKQIASQMQIYLKIDLGRCTETPNLLWGFLVLVLIKGNLLCS